MIVHLPPKVREATRRFLIGLGRLVARVILWLRRAGPGEILKGVAQVLVLAVVVLVLWTLVHTNEANDITGCRAAFRAELVDGPTAAALKAFADGDRAGVTAAVNEAHPDRYAELIALSRRHPRQFLEVCRREDPGA